NPPAPLLVEPPKPDWAWPAIEPGEEALVRPGNEGTDGSEAWVDTLVEDGIPPEVEPTRERILRSPSCPPPPGFVNSTMSEFSFGSCGTFLAELTNAK